MLCFGVAACHMYGVCVCVCVLLAVLGATALNTASSTHPSECEPQNSRAVHRSAGVSKARISSDFCSEQSVSCRLSFQNPCR